MLAVKLHVHSVLEACQGGLRCEVALSAIDSVSLWLNMYRLLEIVLQLMNGAIVYIDMLSQVKVVTQWIQI